MPTPVLSEEELRATVEAVASHGSQNKAAQAITYHRKFGQVGRVTVCPEMLQ